MKNDQHFHITVRPYGADPPPLTVSLTVKYSFFWWRVALPLLKEKVAYFEWNGFYWPKFELHSRDNFHQNYAFPLGNLLQICIRFLGPLLNLSCIEFDFLQNQFMLISCQFWGEEMKAKLFRKKPGEELRDSQCNENIIGDDGDDEVSGIGRWQLWQWCGWRWNGRGRCNAVTLKLVN